MSKVVVTGANGFVGGALVQALVARGEDVRAIVRPKSDLWRLKNLPIEYVVGDLTDAPSLRGAFDEADLIIHAAGMLGAVGTPAATYHRIHVDGTRNLFDELIRIGRFPRIAYISSPGVLGVINSQFSADESWPLHPTNDYERSKADAETLVRRYRDRFPIVIVRPEFIYGPRDLHVLGLFRAIQRGIFFYIDGGEALCHPTYIDDAVQGTLLALDKGKAGECYHIMGQKPVTFREFGRIIAGQLYVRPPFVNLIRPMAMAGATILEAVLPNPPLSRTGVAFFSENRHFSFEKATHELGYFPAVDLAEGCRRTIAWYRENNHLPK